MTFDERKQECIKRGIVPGATVRCGVGNEGFTVAPFDDWKYNRYGSIWTDYECIYSSHRDRYAELITAAPDDEVTRLRERVQELEAERRWIPVTERLPDDRSTVLAIVRYPNGHTFVKSSFYTDGFWSELQASYVTHWMPLPNTPDQP